MASAYSGKVSARAGSNEALASHKSMRATSDQVAPTKAIPEQKEALLRVLVDPQKVTLLRTRSLTPA